MNQVFSVSQINQYIRKAFERDVLLSSVFIKGEVSNLKYHTSGHIYFSLKDESSTIACVMFRGDRSGLAFRMQNGDAVTAAGSVEVFARDGKYQLYAKEIRKDGAGILYEKFEALKRELGESGMFDPMYKQPVPSYAMRIGIVTAPTGAAVRDIEQIARRRNPFVQLFLYPALVEGAGAKESIVRGIRTLDAFGVDVMIVGRGGGSIENLWAFNEECVARAIFECRTPVISAVGHETDTTISDFVADLRAKTPSEAAELAVFDIRSFYDRANRLRDRITVPVKHSLKISSERAKRLALRIRYGSPQQRIRDQRQLAVSLEDRMIRSMEDLLLSQKERRNGYNTRLTEGVHETVRRNDMRLRLMISRMKGLSPLDRLRQGFSFAETETGHPVRSVSDVKQGDLLTVYVSDGKIKSTVRSADLIGDLSPEDDQNE